LKSVSVKIAHADIKIRNENKMENQLSNSGQTVFEQIKKLDENKSPPERKAEICLFA